MTTLPDQMFYVPGQAFAIDFAVERDGELVTVITGENLAAVRERHPEAVIASFTEVQAMIEDGCKSKPLQIDQEDYDYALNVLPPEGWARVGDGESFKMSERTNGRITAIYARQGDTYWKFNGLYNLPHAEIMAIIYASRAELASA